MGTGRAMCVRQAHINASLAKKEVLSIYRGKTAAITAAWKEGFAKLKAENDQMQKNLAEAFKSEMQMNSESIYDMEEAIQK